MDVYWSLYDSGIITLFVLISVVYYNFEYRSQAMNDDNV